MYNTGVRFLGATFWVRVWVGGIFPYSHEQIVLALGRRSFLRIPSAKKHVYFDKKAAKLCLADSLE